MREGDVQELTAVELAAVRGLLRHDHHALVGVWEERREARQERGELRGAPGAVLAEGDENRHARRGEAAAAPERVPTSRGEGGSRGGEGGASPTSSASSSSSSRDSSRTSVTRSSPSDTSISAKPRRHPARSEVARPRTRRHGDGGFATKGNSESMSHIPTLTFASRRRAPLISAPAHHSSHLSPLFAFSSHSASATARSMDSTAARTSTTATAAGFDANRRDADVSKAAARDEAPPPPPPTVAPPSRTLSAPPPTPPPARRSHRTSPEPTRIS